MQAGNPLIGRPRHHRLKCCILGFQVALGSLTAGKGRSRLQDNRLVCLASESEPYTSAILAIILDFIGITQNKVAAEAGRLAPALIDAVDGVIAIDGAVDRVQLKHSLALIAVMVDDDMHRAVLLRRDTEEGSVAAARHLYLQMLIGQTHGIVVGMGYLFVVAEAGGPCRRLQAEHTAEGSDGKRAVVLCTAAHNPMAVAEPLQQGVRIIIRCHALLLRVAGLRRPEVLAIGREDGRQRLPVFLRAFAEEPCRLGVGRSRAHHRVEGTELAQVLQVVNTLGYLLLQVVPEIEAFDAMADTQVKRLLVM